MLDKIEMWDFCQFEKAELNLKKRGLVWIAGENRDTKAASSNGAGKTTISKAITWCLYGKVIDRAARNDEIGDAVIREGQKKAQVQIFLTNGWRITRARSKGKPSLYLLQPDGDEYTGGDIQERIIEIIGLDFHGFKNTCLFGQNDTSRFASPDISDAKRKEMLHKLLRTEILGDCAEIAKKRLTEMKKNVDRLDREIADLAVRIDDLDVPGKQHKELTWETGRETKLEEMRKAILTLKEEATAVTAGASSAAKLRSDRLDVFEALLKLPETEESFEAARKEWSQALEEVEADTARIREFHSSLVRIKEDINSLKGEKCEVCDSDLTTGIPKAKIEALRERFKSESEEMKALKLSKTEWEGKASLRQKSFEKIQYSLTKKAKYKERLSELDLAIAKAEGSAKEAKAILANAHSKLKERKELKAEENPYSVIVSDALADNVEFSKKLDFVQEVAEVSKKDLKLMEFWAKGFGITGLQSFILDEPMPFLTERANHHLEILSDGDIELEFRTQKDTKGGSLKDEIKINWVIEQVADKSPSGGQEQKIEIATDFAFMDLAETREGVTPDLFIGDEIMDGLDAESQERALQLLADLRKRRGTILVISHSSTMSEIFEHQITIVKEDGISRIEES